MPKRHGYIYVNAGSAHGKRLRDGNRTITRRAPENIYGSIADVVENEVQFSSQRPEMIAFIVARFDRTGQTDVNGDESLINGVAVVLIPTGKYESAKDAVQAAEQLSG